jgi:hypothetical protein
MIEGLAGRVVLLVALLAQGIERAYDGARRWLAWPRR